MSLILEANVRQKILREHKIALKTREKHHNTRAKSSGGKPTLLVKFIRKLKSKHFDLWLCI